LREPTFNPDDREEDELERERQDRPGANAPPIELKDELSVPI